MREPLLKVQNLSKHFPAKKGFLRRERQLIRAVDGVTLELFRGETLGLVGESGCGKSTLGRTILRLIEPTSGTVEFEGKDFLKAEGSALLAMRRRMQIVFQDPFGSLHPKMRISQILEEPLIISGYGNSKDRRDRVRELVGLAGLKEEHLIRFPHEFSAGQRQRIAIARSLATNPDLVICDEPVSALDVSVRSQILNLLEDLQRSLGLAYLFISHDLTVVEHICDRIAVMYLGEIVEMGGKEDIFSKPIHPYTRALLAAAPAMGAPGGGTSLLEGDIPSLAAPPEGCRFHPRCRYAVALCKEKRPKLRPAGEGRLASCHLFAAGPQSPPTAGE